MELIQNIEKCAVTKVLILGLEIKTTEEELVMMSYYRKLWHEFPSGANQGILLPKSSSRDTFDHSPTYTSRWRTNLKNKLG